MKRFSTVYEVGKYTIDKDNLNGYYAVFKRTEYGIKQQISKWYFRYGFAVRFLNKYISN